ncbi:hypothetical protein [Micromonospora zamorensis]|uniref:hypothetical protein n=1 Tax=Micromonospora zamorensis TaxID=709883 RepID=UPI00081FC741|nr:hypothetical protein [Micromonospora zamorensis]SCG38234.1 hypothetical protein GA0070619_0621 [Micromonospora zamorensis]
MDVRAVMTEVAERLRTIPNLRVYDYPPGTATAPAAIVSYPESITYDETYGRGMDRMALPVVVLIGRPTDRNTPDKLAAYANGSGSSSVKAVLESGTYTAFDDLRVESADFDVVSLGGTDYMAGMFNLNVWGQGSA